MRMNIVKKSNSSGDGLWQGTCEGCGSEFVGDDYLEMKLGEDSFSHQDCPECGAKPPHALVMRIRPKKKAPEVPTCEAMSKTKSEIARELQAKILEKIPVQFRLVIDGELEFIIHAALDEVETKVAPKIHTTVGVYANGQHVINGCPSDDLATHIKYNVKMRPGRALFLDGQCIHRGYLKHARIESLELEFLAPDGPRATEASNPRT